MHAKIIIVCLIIIFLVIASLFAVLETATVACSKHQLEFLKQKHLWALYAYRLKLKLNQVLIFSLFGNSLFNAIFTTLSTAIIVELLGGLSHALILPITTFIIALIIIIFSEALPKIIAAQAPIATLRFVAIPLYFIFIITQPLIWLIDKVIYSITRLLNINSGEKISLEELKALIADKKSPFQDSHRDILLNSINLKYLPIKEVLIPLRMLESFDIDDDINLIHKHLHATLHTRIIVYQHKIDNIIGFIHTKDILTFTNFNKESLYDVIRPIAYVNDFSPIIQQINIAQKQRQRIFVVINEYGDILGIACLEDMLEMIFGDFTTESPKQQHLAVKNEQGDLIVDGTMLLRELNELYALEIKYGKSFTLNGLILKILNGIPSIGVCFKLDNLVFEVINVGNYWVERVKISKYAS